MTSYRSLAPSRPSYDALLKCLEGYSLLLGVLPLQLEDAVSVRLLLLGD